MKPHIIVILDNSGSMSNAASRVIKSFNTFLEEQKQERGEALLTLIVFNSDVTVVYDAIDIQDANSIDRSVYNCHNLTAMYDAVGTAITRSKGGKSLVVIQTDGHENASKNYNKPRAAALVQQKITEDWEFLFMAANIDVTIAASTLGLENHCIAFDTSAKGLETAFGTMSNRASKFRADSDKAILKPSSSLR